MTGTPVAGATTNARTAARTAGRAAGLAVAYAAAGFAGAVAAMLLALQGGDIQRGLVLRALLVAVVLVVVTVLSSRRRPLWLLLGIGLAGYALDPAAWNGQAFLGQLWFEPGIVTVAVDGIVWIAVVAVTRVVVDAFAPAPVRRRKSTVR